MVDVVGGWCCTSGGQAILSNALIQKLFCSSYSGPSLPFALFVRGVNVVWKKRNLDVRIRETGYVDDPVFYLGFLFGDQPLVCAC